MTNQLGPNSEPVPPASQLAIIPFLAAVDGFLRDGNQVSALRLTMHRAVNREGQLYLQQVCGYVTENGLDWKGKVGRTFEVSKGIMGAAFASKKIWRTKEFESLDALRSKLKGDLDKTGDTKKLDDVEVSFLAIPFLGPQGEPVLILYADCKEVNFFASDDRVKHVAAMGTGFCRLFDWLQSDPFLNLRNFPLEKGAPVVGIPTVYESVQEKVENIEPPKFQTLLSFNYEAAAA